MATGSQQHAVRARVSDKWNRWRWASAGRSCVLPRGLHWSISPLWDPQPQPQVPAIPLLGTVEPWAHGIHFTTLQHCIGSFASANQPATRSINCSHIHLKNNASMLWILTQEGDFTPSHRGVLSCVLRLSDHFFQLQVREPSFHRLGRGTRLSIWLEGATV